MSVNYDIPAEQGSDFWLHIRYLDDDGNPINLSNYSAKMEIRRSYEMDGVLAVFTGNPFGATVGLTGGTMGGTYGFTGGYGGISLNRSIDGATGQTGGMLLFVSGVGMGDMPIGKFVYDIQIKGTTGNNVIRLMEGRFDSSPRVTR